MEELKAGASGQTVARACGGMLYARLVLRLIVVRRVHRDARPHRRVVDRRLGEIARLEHFNLPVCQTDDVSSEAKQNEADAESVQDSAQGAKQSSEE